MANRSRYRDYWLSEDGLEKIATMRKGGYTIDEIAKTIGVGRGTIHRWAKENETLKNNLFLNSEIAIVEVESQLMKNIKSGNQRAVEFYLLNRASSRWNNRQEVEHKGSVDVNHIIQKLAGDKF